MNMGKNFTKASAGAAVVGILAITMLLGMVAGQPVLIMPAFCLWTPAIAYTAYQLGRSGRAIVVRSPIHLSDPDVRFEES